MVTPRHLFLVIWISLSPLSAQADQSSQRIGEAVEELPLFDAHMHYSKPAWKLLSPRSVIELMDRNRVAMALVSSTPDDGTIALWQYAPQRILPELRSYYGKASALNWTKVTGMREYIKQRMATYPHRGIGEFHLHRIDIRDRPLFTLIAELALENKAIIHVHSQARIVEWLYSIEPRLTILWAHAGVIDTPAKIDRMMGKYPRLYADTSLREEEIIGEGYINLSWKRLLTKYSERFMIGSDTWLNSQWRRYDEIMRINREWLQELPRDVAERIAYKNAEHLFDIQIMHPAPQP